MKPMIINGMEISFNERPKHKSVTAARGIMTRELMKLLDVSDIDPTKGVSDALNTMIVENPELASHISALQSELELDQTIMLSTELQYSTLQELKEEMYADEFIKLYEKSMEALGGKSAEDFFAIYPTSTSLDPSSLARM